MPALLLFLAHHFYIKKNARSETNQVSDELLLL